MSAQSSSAVLEREAVRACVAAVTTHIDQRHWRELRALFSDKVVLDYTSLFGGDIKTQPADELIESWRKSLTALTATQHLLGPIHAEVEGELANAQCHVRAVHLGEGLPGGEEWTVAGHYLFALQRQGDAWKIQKMTLQTFFQTGNQKLLQEAAGAS